MKSAAEVILELEEKIEQEKAKDNHSFWGMNYIVEQGAASIIEKYFLENGCYYVKFSPCGCGEHTYDVILQWM